MLDSVEFFEQARARLADGGTMARWIPTRRSASLVDLLERAIGDHDLGRGHPRGPEFNADHWPRDEYFLNNRQDGAALGAAAPRES